MLEWPPHLQSLDQLYQYIWRKPWKGELGWQALGGLIQHCHADSPIDLGSVTGVKGASFHA